MCFQYKWSRSRKKRKSKEKDRHNNKARISPRFRHTLARIWKRPIHQIFKALSPPEKRNNDWPPNTKTKFKTLAFSLGWPSLRQECWPICNVSAGGTAQRGVARVPFTFSPKCPHFAGNDWRARPTSSVPPNRYFCGLLFWPSGHQLPQEGQNNIPETE